MAFALPDNLTYCWLGSQAVFLDIERDRYFTLDAALAATLLKLERAQPISGSDEEIIASFLDQGILVRDEPGSIAPCAASETRDWAAADRPDVKRQIAVVPALLVDLIIARRMISRKPLRAILCDIVARRSRAELVGSRASPVTLFEIAFVFDGLGGIVGALDECLPRSIALMRNLTRRGFSPRMVFGVMWRPFAAHCWVEIDDRLIGDRLENIRKFTPIRVV